MDVDANRWNDTGLTVQPLQRLNFEVLRGSVVWRAGGFFTGSAGEAPPQGDPTVTPGNTLLWIDPQIPINQAPIGALIGMVIDLKPGVQLTEKPDGATYFRVLTGGAVTMPVAGKVYLGINDGGFFNNGGCFQVRVTR
jgi:hypothetical protein